MSSSDEDEWSIRRDLTTRKGKHDERQSGSDKRARATSTPNEPNERYETIEYDEELMNENEIDFLSFY